MPALANACATQIEKQVSEQPHIEDNVLGKVTNKQFRMLSDGYNAEQRDIQEQITKLQAAIQKLKAASNVDKFVDIAYKYTGLQELTP